MKIEENYNSKSRDVLIDKEIEMVEKNLEYFKKAYFDKFYDIDEDKKEKTLFEELTENDMIRRQTEYIKEKYRNKIKMYCDLLIKQAQMEGGGNIPEKKVMEMEIKLEYFFDFNKNITERLKRKFVNKIVDYEMEESGKIFSSSVESDNNDFFVMEEFRENIYNMVDSMGKIEKPVIKGLKKKVKGVLLSLIVSGLAGAYAVNSKNNKYTERIQINDSDKNKNSIYEKSIVEKLNFNFNGEIKEKDHGDIWKVINGETLQEYTERCLKREVENETELGSLIANSKIDYSGDDVMVIAEENKLIHWKVLDMIKILKEKYKDNKDKKTENL